MAHSAKVELDPAAAADGTTERRLIAAVEDRGYSAKVRADEEPEPMLDEVHAKEAKEWRRQFVGSLLFTLPVVLLSMVVPMFPYPAGTSLAFEVSPGLSAHAPRPTVPWLT